MVTPTQGFQEDLILLQEHLQLLTIKPIEFLYGNRG